MGKAYSCDLRTRIAACPQLPVKSGEQRIKRAGAHQLGTHINVSLAPVEA